MNRHCVIPLGLSALLIAVPAAAHHSFAMFDVTRTVTLNGTVKELQWTNPHCFIQVVVADQGTQAEWSIEMNGPGNMYRAGWRPKSFIAGDKVTIVVNPLRDGTLGGRLVSATTPEGKTLTDLRPQT